MANQSTHAGERKKEKKKGSLSLRLQGHIWVVLRSGIRSRGILIQTVQSHRPFLCCFLCSIPKMFERFESVCISMSHHVLSSPLGFVHLLVSRTNHPCKHPYWNTFAVYYRRFVISPGYEKEPNVLAGLALTQVLQGFHLPREFLVSGNMVCWLTLELGENVPGGRCWSPSRGCICCLQRRDTTPTIISLSF